MSVSLHGAQRLCSCLLPEFWLWCYPRCILWGCWNSCGWAPLDKVGAAVNALCARCKKGKTMFFFLFVPHQKRVISGKIQCGCAEGWAGFWTLCRLCGGAVGSEVFITPKLASLSFLFPWFVLGNHSPAQKPWTILQICFAGLFLSLCVFLGLFSFWCGNNYIACFLCSGSDWGAMYSGFLCCVFFFFHFFSSAVSAIKIFWTAVAAHVEHRNVCFVVARHACSGCASLFCLCPHGWPSFIIAIKLGRYNLH